MTDPADPGTIPSIVGEPLAGAAIGAPQFDFPRGFDAPPPGPVGPKQGDRSLRDVPGLTPWPMWPGAFRTFSMEIASPGTATWIPYDTSRPVVLVPYRSTIAAAATSDLRLAYCPQAAGNTLTGAIPPSTLSDAGIPGSRCAAHLWAAGRWWLCLRGSGAPARVDFVEVPAEDRTVADLLMRPWDFGGRGAVPGGTFVLAAATLTTLFETSATLLLDYLRIENEGANPARIHFSLGATATSGYLLTPDAPAAAEPSNAPTYMEFYGARFPVSRLRAFSNLGTTLQAYTVSRAFNG